MPPEYFALCFILFLSEFSPNSCLAYIPTNIDVYHRNSKRYYPGSLYIKHALSSRGYFPVETPETKLDYNGPDPVIISISRSGRSSALDFLKVSRFSFPVPVVGPSVKLRSLTLFCRRKQKKIYRLRFALVK